MSNLNRKVAIVTGASRGIGAAIAKRLATEGARVIVNYSGDGALYRSLHPDVRFRFANIARWESEDDWKEAGEKHRAEQGIDGLSDWTDLDIKVYPATYREEMRY